MSKFETLLALANAGLPVPPSIEFRPGDEVDGTEVRRRLGCPVGALYAVRSSYEAEDGDGRSYAGQFKTLLDVPEESLSDAVRQVGESYAQDVVYDRTNAQRGSQSVTADALEDDGETGSIVIVQPMVDAQASGVAFTSNPEGFVGESVVVIGEGAGEGVVTDSVDTATWHLPCDGTMWSHGSEGVLGEIDDETVMTVVSLAKRCATVIGAEADMEFAISGDGRVIILQARPITVIGGIPARDAVAGKVLLDNSNIVESYPGVVLPLTQDFAGDIYERLFTAAATRLCGDRDLVSQIDRSLSTLVTFSDWHAYYRISSWYDLLSFLPAHERLKGAWRKSLGVTDGEGDLGSPIGIGFRARARVASRFARCLRRIEPLMRKACDEAERILDETETRVSEAASFEELWDAYEMMRDGIMAHWDVTLINDINTFMFVTLAGEATKVAEGNRQQVESMKPVLAMRRLVSVAKEYGMASREYHAAKNDFIDDYGDRCIGELKLETKTWRSNPAMLDAYVKSRILRSAGLPSSHSKDCEFGGGVPSVRLRNPKLDGDDGKRGMRTLAFSGRAKSGTANRERSRLLRTRMFGVSRELFLRCGDLFASRHVIDAPRDIFYLRLMEIRRIGLAIDSGDTTRAAAEGESFRHVIADRKGQEQALRKMPIPARVWVVDGRHHDHSIPSSASGQAEPVALSEGEIMRGTGTSRGAVTAPVMIVDGSDMMADATGHVLVTCSTDPGWAFLISEAAGVIAERGSLLSHTAIISRELGVPAVVGIAGATEALKDGDLVEIDGGAGTVRLVRRNTSNENAD